MRRTLLGIAAAVTMVLASVGAVAASESVDITIKSATVVAKGAAVDVAFDVVCQPNLDSTTFTSDMGSWVNIDQAVHKTMTHGSLDLYGREMVCDGATANALTVRVVAQTVPFRKGPAIVSVRMNLVEYVYWGWFAGETSVAMSFK